MGTTQDEREAFWKAVHVNSDRITELEAKIDSLHERMREAIQDAVREAMPASLLSTEEHRWVQLAIQREAQAIAFRRAVIEKTLLGLIWAAVIAAGVMVREYMLAHGMWKP